MQTIMTVATARPVAQPLRVKLNWSSRGLLIRGVRVQLASPALCIIGVTVALQNSTLPVRVRVSYDALFYRSVAELAIRGALKMRCPKGHVGSTPT